MSLPTTKTFTLGDLSKIALGSNELTNEHLSVLQSLLIILLQKLNCHNESVRIQGFSAECIQKLLKDTPSNNDHYNIQIKSIKGYQEKYELLEKLEKKTQEIDLKLQKHFEQIRNCHKTNIFESKMWDFYASSNEDLCTLYKRSNKQFCMLARNALFNKELRSRVSQLMVERLKEFENKIEIMQNKLKEVMQIANKAAGRETCIQYIVKDIEDMRGSLVTNMDNFREAMVETQEMLNCKLERVALPALKKYLEQNFADIKKHLKILQKEKSKCTIIKAFDIENKSMCLSCGCGNDLIKSKAFKPFKTCDENKKCFCHNVQKEPTILEKMDRMMTSDSKVMVFSTPISSTHRFSRQSEIAKNKLQLESHGILTNYNSSTKMPTQVTEQLSAIKTSMKKPQKPEILKRIPSQDSRKIKRSLSFG